MPQQTPISRYLLAAFALCMFMAAIPVAENAVRQWSARLAGVQTPQPIRVMTHWI